MSTAGNGRTDPPGSGRRGNFTPRDQTAAGTRQSPDVLEGDVVDGPDQYQDQDLAARLRALRAEMPRRGVDSVFPDLVRARARRHRSRARVAGVAALVLAIVVGVGIPVSLRGGGNDEMADAAASPAVPYTYGGMTITWLPVPLAHQLDMESQSVLHGAVGALPGAPPISIAAHLFSQDSYDQNIAAFTSQFIALSSAIKPVAGEPSAVWVTVIWQPSNPSVATARQLRSQLKQLPVVVGDIEVSETTVGGQPAAFAQNDLSAVTNLHLRDTSYRYGGLLTWLTPSGALLAVEAHSFTPVDVAVLRRIGAGLVLGQQPPSTPPPT